VCRHKCRLELEGRTRDGYAIGSCAGGRVMYFDRTRAVNQKIMHCAGAEGQSERVDCDANKQRSGE
jgi:hypothetical protein